MRIRCLFAVVLAFFGTRVRAEDWEPNSPACVDRVLVDNVHELSFRMDSCRVDLHPKFVYTVNSDFTMQAWYTWAGTARGERMEFDFRVHFDFPDGSTLTLEREWDKHSDLRGNWDDWRPLRLTLPAGTKIRLETNGWGSPTSPNSQTDVIVRFYADAK